MNQSVTETVSCQNRINSFFDNQRIALLLKQSNIVKLSGISPVVVMRMIFSLVFTGKNLFRYLLQADASGGEVGKDTVYRSLNSVNANWRKFLHLLCVAVLNQKILPLTSAQTTKVFIVDDSLYNRNRSKHVELLARVHDHNDNRYYRGFRLLTLGWSDGSSYLPVSFSLLSSANQKNRLAPMAKVDQRTNGFKRRIESLRKSPDVLKDLVKQAHESGIRADYLLFDNWFAFPATIIRLLEQKQQVICMLEEAKTKYGYQGFDLTLKELYKSVRKRSGRAKILASVQVELGTDSRNQAVMAKIVFVRARNTKKWLALLSTDANLADEEIIKLYKRRWDIEVFFKISKSYLRLAKEFQSHSYDALVAHTAIVFARYIMLELARRSERDPRTLGTLFHAGCDELRQASFMEAITLLLSSLQQLVKSFSDEITAPVAQALGEFMAQIPGLLRRPMLLPACIL